MSTRLDLALHEIADAAGDATAFGDDTAAGTVATVRRLTGRVRRRRAARGAGAAAVAASAAGAVVLVGPQLTVDPTPAVAPGACGTPFTGTGDDAGDAGFTIGVDAGTVPVPAGSTSFGTWQSRTLAVAVEVEVPLPEGATPDGTGTVPVEQPASPDLVLTRDDVVVAETVLDPSRAVAAGSAWEASGDDVPGLLVSQVVEDGEVSLLWTSTVDVVACDTGGALPSGDYEVWATHAGTDGVERVVGPYDLTLAAEQPSVASSLPADFPPGVPLVGGRLVSATRDGDRWTVEVATPATDREVAALRMLSAAALRTGGAAGEMLTAPDGGIVLDGWSVRVTPTSTSDGEPSVVYVLTPTD
jgi:hypothetical protein